MSKISYRLKERNLTLDGFWDKFPIYIILFYFRANLPTVALGAGIDPLGHGLYTSKDALKNISVPLDVPYSLSVLYEAFDKSQYTSRALQHSRKLMVLYLSAQQNSKQYLS